MPTVLSIQSHVVHGHVGNKSATFPLQLQGWEVLALNTLQYSNHPGYGKFTGVKASADEVLDLIKGLEEIGIIPDVVLGGYVPTPEVLKVVGDSCVELSRKHNVIWVLDPVLGDHGRIYVSEENIQIYKDLLSTGEVKLVTPNQLELEVLSGVKINTLLDLKEAVIRFMELYKVENLVVSSILIKDFDGIISIGSTKAEGIKAWSYELKAINASFSGSGDLFSALLTNSWFSNGFKLIEALGEALSIVEKVLELTYEYKLNELKSKNEPIPDHLIIHDLNIVQARGYYNQHLQTYKSKQFI